jgi:hypothetical protein
MWIDWRTSKFRYTITMKNEDEKYLDKVKGKAAENKTDFWPQTCINLKK